FGLPPTVRWESLVQERFVLVAPPGTGDMNWKAAMSGHAFLRYNRHSFGGRLVERLIEQQGVLVNEWVEIDDIPALLSLRGSFPGRARHRARRGGNLQGDRYFDAANV
ncbi:MAG: hypothetical protein E5Y61_34420, partial [Mesorhizobium sp.]